ncbi:hypothetical protein H5410_032087, partial [Solanum commersonii]
MLDSLNEIDPVSFYTSSDVPSPSKMLTISPINITKANPFTLQSPIDLNNPAPSHQRVPYSTILSDHLFEGDLPRSKSSESNILIASENIIIESLVKMREGVIHEVGGSFANEKEGTKRNKNDQEVNKQTIVDNLRLHKVLGGRVFNTEILTNLGMDSLTDLVELQLWTHLFITKSHILHEEQVREFYYNVEFAENGSLNTFG